MESEPRRSFTGVTMPKPERKEETGSDRTTRTVTSRSRGQKVEHTPSLLCLLMLSDAMPPCGAAGYMEGMLVFMKSAICCRASRLVGVFPFCS
ncbi:hypothetical protein EYF80_006589 [Liparis tanakae]|uniref:Uncharacterized protein n=1 Tax=Liparis tanakae TaxID=230148 RepID=A0A4Z2IZD8_9TELE|nr:hypothetical protein EYF80_006589 [Liparis tanakae]